jgi:catechol 2,3-dioxygenase-like lactoylglutathione lyase family enzyme
MIDGVGGAFIFSNDARRLASWYRDHLGMQFEGDPESGSFYQVFWGLDPEEATRKLDTTFSIMQATVELPRSDGGAESDSMYGDQPFMVNLRVRDLDGLLEFLAARGVAPIKCRDYEYGRFAWVRDADGNRIELYQPVQGD